MGIHVNSGTPSGMILGGLGHFMAGCTLFRIEVNGVGSHGAMPEKGIDPINIAAHIYLSLPVSYTHLDTPIQQGHTLGFYDEVILFMRNLFSGVLKDNKHLSYGFLTGILRVAKESI